MTETLRDKLIRCGWVTNFNADTLVQLIERHYAALAQPEPVERPIWTEGICGDGAAILKDGVMQPIESVIAALNAAELAQPEPQGPTDEELWDLYQELGRDFSPPEFARAVLARWGRPAIKPVPVAERLPGPGDFDTEGECWWWHPDHKEDEFSDGWMLLKPKWADGHHDADDSPVHTHWLPHHALPVPQQGE